MLTDIISSLPSTCYGMYTLATTHHIANHIVHAYLIIEIIETSTKIVAIFSRIIHLANKHNIRIAILNLICSPLPECSWHHLSHIATESVDTLRGPEQQDISHLIPCIWNRIKVTNSTSIIIKTIVEFNCLIPVVHAWSIVETIVTSGLGRLLNIRFCLAMIQVEIRRKTLTRTIVEVVLWVETILWIILFAKILHPFRSTDRVILTSHMIRNKVDDDLKTSLVTTLYQSLELGHTMRNLNSQVWIDIIIIRDGIRRTCLTLNHSWMLARNAISCIIGLSGMTDNTCIPNMAHAHRPDFLQDGGREVVQLSTSVLG